MGKHLLDETAEFTMPRPGRHAAPDTAELEATQRFDAGLRQPRPGVPNPQFGKDAEQR
ncbi:MULTISPECIES: hypothetical protein [unclassified Blastococcus]|uniref:hypothetical protein n=1 Tax=unclassified Blastococcus TaxID=2619396 RepID=UPI001EEFAEB0|nr:MULTISPECIES: hypothetical protein [unclassified Blastococcus]